MSCTLYLVRHAIAALAAPGVRDRERRLTPEGTRRMRHAAAGLKQLGIVPAVILASPLVRAKETAAILVRRLAPQLSVEIYAPLAPGHAPRDVLDGLHLYRACRQVMLVGHQPDLGELASYLLTGSPTTVPLPFKKGGIAAIEVDAIPPHGSGVLRWFLAPGQLRAVAGRK